MGEQVDSVAADAGLSRRTGPAPEPLPCQMPQSEMVRPVARCHSAQIRSTRGATVDGMKRPALAVAVLLGTLSLSACADEEQPFPPKFLHYTFDDDSGNTVVDSSGAGHDGTRVGATPVDGAGGGALSFDGTGDYIDAGALDMGSAWSVALWFRSRAVEDGRTIFEGNWTEDPFNPSGGLTIMMGAVGSGYVGYNLGGWGTYIASIGAGEWHHVVVAYDEGIATGYFDGRKTSSLPGVASPASFSNIRIGRGTTSGAPEGLSPYFEGDVDDIRVYAGALNWIHVGDLLFEDAD